MRKLLVLAAGLVLAATPAAAQQAAPSPSRDAPAVQHTTSLPTLDPSLYASRAEVREAVAANEAALGETQMGSSSWWGLVLAVALGVVIALLLID